MHLPDGEPRFGPSRVRRIDDVAYRPPPWDARRRPGAITVPVGCPLVVVDGAGIGRRGLAGYFDALIWVQADRNVAWARGLARDGGGAEQEAFWLEREAEEQPFDGAPALTHDPAIEVAVAVLDQPRSLRPTGG